MLGSWFRVPGFRFRVSGSRFQVPGAGFLVSGAGFRVEDAPERIDLASSERLSDCIEGRFPPCTCPHFSAILPSFVSLFDFLFSWPKEAISDTRHLLALHRSDSLIVVTKRGQVCITKSLRVCTTRLSVFAFGKDQMRSARLPGPLFKGELSLAS